MLRAYGRSSSAEDSFAHSSNKGSSPNIFRNSGSENYSQIFGGGSKYSESSQAFFSKADMGLFSNNENSQ